MLRSSELKPWYSRATGEYTRRKRAAESQVVRWEWMTRPGRHALDPVYFQRNEFGRGKVLAKPPVPVKILNIAYGLDADDRIVVERECCTFDGKGFYHCFYDWRDDSVEWVRYHPDRRAQSVTRAVLAGGRAAELATLADFGGYETRFTWEAARLRRIEETHVSPKGRDGTRVYDVSWDVAGRLSSIVEKSGLDERVRYQAPARGVTLATLLDAAVETIVDAMPEVVRELKPDEPVYALVVAYPGEGNDNFPPTVGVGTVRERAAVVARAQGDLASALWNPGDYDHYDTELTQLAGHKALFAQLNPQISQKDAWRQMHKAFAEIASRLRARDWSRDLEITDDFTVIAVDYDETRLSTALRAALPAKTYAAWKKKGWAR